MYNDNQLEREREKKKVQFMCINLIFLYIKIIKNSHIGKKKNYIDVHLFPNLFFLTDFMNTFRVIFLTFLPSSYKELFNASDCMFRVDGVWV